MSKIAEKIGKIINKASSTNSEAEAEMLMEKALAMLEEHGLSFADIGAANAEDPVGVEKAAVKFFASQYHRLALYVALARYYGCETIHVRRGNEFRIDVIGRESARTTFKLMVPFVLEQLNAVVKPLVGTYYESRDKALRAVSNRLAQRVYLLTVEAQKRDAEVKAERGFALVPVDLIDAAMKEHYPRATTARSGKLNLGGNAAAQAAASVSLHRQTTGAGQLKIGRN